MKFRKPKSPFTPPAGRIEDAMATMGNTIMKLRGQERTEINFLLTQIEADVREIVNVEARRVKRELKRITTAKESPVVASKDPLLQGWDDATLTQIATAAAYQSTLKAIIQMILDTSEEEFFAQFKTSSTEAMKKFQGIATAKITDALTSRLFEESLTDVPPPGKKDAN